MLLRSIHCTTPKAKKPRKKLIPETLRAVYADVVAKAIELRQQGITHPEVCEELNRLVVTLSIDAAGRIIRKSVDNKDNRRLVQEFVSSSLTKEQ